MRHNPGEAFKRDFARWVAAKPPAVQAAFKEFPPLSFVLVNDRPLWVLGFQGDQEPLTMILTPVDPREDYQGAMQARIYICHHCFLEHARKVAVH